MEKSPRSDLPGDVGRGKNIEEAVFGQAAAVDRLDLTANL
jgi:hypothetical protein